MCLPLHLSYVYVLYISYLDAVTIVLFTVLSAFSNRPFDSGIDVGLDPDARNVTVADVRELPFLLISFFCFLHHGFFMGRDPPPHLTSEMT